MAGLYSTRFIAALGPAEPSFQVPAGQLGLVRAATAYNANPAAESWSLRLAPDNIYFAGGTLEPFRAAAPLYYVIYQELRVVIKATEYIVATIPDGMYVTCSGYLFSSL